MKKGISLYFDRNIMMLFTPDEYIEIESELQYVPEKYQKAFCNIILFGLSITSAYRNCKKLYEIVTFNNIDYETALNMIFFIDTTEEIEIFSRDITYYTFN